MQHELKTNYSARCLYMSTEKKVERHILNFCRWLPKKGGIGDGGVVHFSLWIFLLLKVLQRTNITFAFL